MFIRGPKPLGTWCKHWLVDARLILQHHLVRLHRRHLLLTIHGLPNIQWTTKQKVGSFHCGLLLQSKVFTHWAIHGVIETMVTIGNMALLLWTLQHMHLHNKIIIQVCYLLHGLPRETCFEIGHDIMLLVLLMVGAIIVVVVVETIND